MHGTGYPSYTTSAGWLGYSDDALKQKCVDLKERGWRHFKIKVGRDLADDQRRCRVLRREMGDDAHVIATGGFAPLIERNTTQINAVDENLLLDGLQRLHTRLTAT